MIGRQLWLVATLVAGPFLATGGAQATGTRYECAFETGHRRDGNWVPSVLVVQHEDGATTALVFDPLIRDFVGTPIQGSTGDQSSVRTSFVWKLDVRTPTRQAAAMTYTFTYYRNGHPAKLTAVPAGYDNRFSGEGTCKVTRG